MTTDDHARDGVPVGTRPPPNLLPPVILLGVRRLYQMATYTLRSGVRSQDTQPTPSKA